eukprot:scaffold808_cov196-Alexandrium_tamarense.AAC.80
MINQESTPLGGNWMKKSTTIKGIPAEALSGDMKDEFIKMDVGIGGKEFGTGPLSKRMFDAMMTVALQQFRGDLPDGLREAYLEYAMDASAKEAVKVAMDSNGYEMNLGDDIAMQDVGAWGVVENVLLLDDGEKSYESWADAIVEGGWEPGDAFSFIVREVPSLQKSMDLASLLKALDPDGTLREEAKEKGMLLPDEDVASLKDLGVDCMQRINAAPVPTTGEKDVFRGGTSKGYNVISRSSLLRENRNADGTENQKVVYTSLTSLLIALLHVMDSLANHGCLIVDLTDEDKSLDGALTMSKMWDATTDFFQKVIDKDETAKIIPAMAVAEGVGSSHAMVGFASFKNGDNQFLETRIRRSDGALLPEETRSVIGDDGAQSMVDAFRVMAEVGKDIVRIATAASSVEADAFVTVGSVVSQEEGSPSIAELSFEEASVSGLFGDNEADGEASGGDKTRGDILASEAAILLTEEIMDDGKPLVNKGVEHDEGPVSMSPHRICRYSNGNDKKSGASEVFGAHTDTSFVTIVPAAAVSGLEIFDEDSLQWYRPELNARKHARGLDPKGEKDSQFPWHSRYLVVMPGELLQITSRNNVQAAVHRVVATNQTPRLSAPVLLRARPGTKMDVERYLGSLDKADSLLLECNSMSMEDIHDALQMRPMEQSPPRNEGAEDWA